MAWRADQHAAIIGTKINAGEHRPAAGAPLLGPAAAFDVQVGGSIDRHYNYIVAPFGPDEQAEIVQFYVRG